MLFTSQGRSMALSMKILLGFLNNNKVVMVKRIWLQE
ncbi:hypothetical protein Vsou_08170 [Vulcanisaeta souniana JCM 11219]|uniref:Uncharacterized protein n=1 Tax=Vulcanisaeta souniana JCM 11219 TaxID=1293586 RepID=A0ABN6SQA5_9CREN|nr:hypothetical protein Vsou_08170 [Vulcanisaeta souniana JCM 11219]